MTVALFIYIRRKCCNSCWLNWLCAYKLCAWNWKKYMALVCHTWCGMLTAFLHYLCGHYTFCNSKMLTFDCQSNDCIILFCIIFHMIWIVLSLCDDLIDFSIWTCHSSSSVDIIKLWHNLITYWLFGFHAKWGTKSIATLCHSYRNSYIEFTFVYHWRLHCFGQLRWSFSVFFLEKKQHK